jgi:hypothetical protein
MINFVYGVTDDLPTSSICISSDELTSLPTEQDSSSDKAFDLFSGGDQFESRQRCRLSLDFSPGFPKTR